jgi:hypothetical protein
VRSRRRLTSAAVAVLAILVSTGLSSGAARAAAAAPHVSVISDSILTSVTWNSGPAEALLTDGFDMQIDAAVCRRLNGESCEFNGSRAPTTLRVIASWSSHLGSVVVIVDGYNDLPETFAADLELTLDTLRDHGVQHVLWVNLHEVRPDFAAKNAVLAAAARRHPELRVLDWNSFSAPHQDWYQNDFIHLTAAGGVGIAGFIHEAVADALAPPPPPPKLTVPTRQTMHGRVGVRFDRRLAAGTGNSSLRWRTKGASVRKAGLHLSAGGELTGTPTRPGTYLLPLVASNAGGATARVTVAFRVRPAGVHSKTP